MFIYCVLKNSQKVHFLQIISSLPIMFIICIIKPLEWRRQWHPTPVLLPGKSHGWRSLEGCSPWGGWGSDTTERLHFHFSLSCVGEGNGNPLQCSCLESPRDGEARWAAVYGVTQSRTWLKWLSSTKPLEKASIKIQKPLWLKLRLNTLKDIFYKVSEKIFCSNKHTV